MNFNDIFNINVNEHTEKRNKKKSEQPKKDEDLTYLSWAWAWAEFKKIYPDATYKIQKNAENLPYFYNSQLGYMVYTEVTAGGLTYEMWLPVMDIKSKAMKDVAWEYNTDYGKKTVAAATMTDINKAVMRCLTKNLAMFGLGLYIYAGEDLPEQETEEEPQTADNQEKKNQPTKPAEKPFKPATAEQWDEVKNFGGNPAELVTYFKVKSVGDVSYEALEKLLIKKRKQAEIAEKQAIEATKTEEKPQ